MGRRSQKAGPISNVVCPGCKRSLDDVIESLIRQRGKFKGQRQEAIKRAEKAEAKVEALKVEVEHLKGEVDFLVNGDEDERGQ